MSGCSDGAVPQYRIAKGSDHLKPTPSAKAYLQEHGALPIAVLLRDPVIGRWVRPPRTHMTGCLFSANAVARERRMRAMMSADVHSRTQKIKKQNISACRRSLRTNT